MKYLRYLIYLFVLVGFSTAKAGSYEDFFIAVNRDDFITVNELLQRGFDPNTLDSGGQLPINIAMRESNFRVAKSLLASQAFDVNAVNHVGETPLMAAAIAGQVEWCDRFLARGAEIDLRGWSPIHYAASSTTTATVRFLLEKGAPLDAESPNRTTPLMMAARYGAIDSAELLLARGAKAGLKNDQGMTAADFARSAERDRLALLIDKAIAAGR